VKLTRVGLLPAVGGLEQLVDHARRVEALRQTLERDLDRVQKLDRERAALGEKLAELREQRDSVEAQRRAMAQARQVLLAARDRELAFERAFSGAGSDHTAIYGAAASPSDSSDPTAGFAGMRGRLPFPLPGRVEVRRAHAPSGGGAGLEMTAPNGTAVRAVGPGRVAFADEYPDYGRSVIVDHGGGYFTVSARLDALDVRAGDDVSAGSRIGSIGGLAPGATLYFEVRSGMDTLDPSEWFGI
jgi:septal ring factor EnvC (AmiA/AmiB activator)